MINKLYVSTIQTFKFYYNQSEFNNKISGNIMHLFAYDKEIVFFKNVLISTKFCTMVLFNSDY